LDDAYRTKDVEAQDNSGIWERSYTLFSKETEDRVASPSRV
jgi:hypothetical protein